MAFLDFVKPSLQANSTFCNHKSAVVCSFCILFGFKLGKGNTVDEGLENRTTP